MRRARGGYSSYRGRRTLHDILKWIAVVLLVLVVLALGVLRLADVPVPPEENPSDAGSVSEAADLPAEDRQEEQESGDPVPEAEDPALAALELPLETVLDGSAPGQLEAAGANGLILSMKNEEGQLGWVSQQSLAILAGVSAQEGEVNEVLRQWNEGELYTVARVCCFRDNAVPYQRNDVALRASYGNWRDELGLRWMNPASADAQAYLAGLCVELAELGFDEILLECCGFPAQGNLSAITMEEVSRAQVMEDFLRQVQEALEPYDTRLSIRTDASALTGGDMLSGLTAAGLETYADRLWLSADGGTIDLMASAGITKAAERLVRIVPALEDGSGSDQAVLG